VKSRKRRKDSPKGKSFGNAVAISGISEGKRKALVEGKRSTTIVKNTPPVLERRETPPFPICPSGIALERREPPVGSEDQRRAGYSFPYGREKD